jgi:hypothetical protein
MKSYATTWEESFVKTKFEIFSSPLMGEGEEGGGSEIYPLSFLPSRQGEGRFFIILGCEENW